MIEVEAPRRILLLFIHGLGGDSTTWGSFPDLLKGDPSLKEIIDLEFYRYPSKTIRLPWSKPSIRIQDLSRALRTELGVRFKAYSEVVVVAHSMGGVIAQKYIVDELKEKLQLRVKGLILFAVPTTGAQLAKWGDLISFRHRHLKQLRRESDLLEAIREDWRHLDCKNSIKTLAVFGGQDTIVPYVLSPGEQIEYIANEDHQSIVKPQSKTSTSFLLLRSFLIDNFFGSECPSAPSRPPKNQGPPLSLRAKSNSNVLFDTYRPHIEPYYIVRREDAVVSEYISRQNLWLFGPSGQGKSVALTRALAGIDYRIVSLGHHIGAGVKDLFVAMHDALDSNRTRLRDAASLTWPQLIEAISFQLTSLCQTGTKWVLVEEMPLGRSDQLSEFLTRLSSLLLLHSQLRSPERIAFAFSSINDPRAGVEDMHRTSQILKVMKFSAWRNQDLERLLALLMRELMVEFPISDQIRLLAEPSISPRFMKVFFGNYLNLLPIVSDAKHALEEALATTRSELPT